MMWPNMGHIWKWLTSFYPHSIGHGLYLSEWETGQYQGTLKYLN